MWNTILSHHLIDPPWTGNVTNEPIQHEPSETQTSQNQEALAERCTNGAHAYAYSAPHLYSMVIQQSKMRNRPRVHQYQADQQSKGSEPRFARSTNTDRQQLTSRSSSTSWETPRPGPSNPSNRVCHQLRSRSSSSSKETVDANERQNHQKHVLGPNALRRNCPKPQKGVKCSTSTHRHSYVISKLRRQKPRHIFPRSHGIN